MPTLLKAALLGILQGLVEFLPVSSTAHLLIGGRLLGYDDPGGVFTVMIQLGSIFAVMWLYREKLIAVLAGLPSRPEARHFALMIGLATVPALVAGGLKPDMFDVDSLPVGRALAIGSFQALALVPGVSRSGGTIVAAMAMRVDRAAAAEFTFFLAMPTMAAAFGKNLLDVRHDLGSARGLEIAVGFVMAFIASALVVKPFLNFVKRSGFAPFAWYRILFGIALLAAVAAGWT